LGQRRYLTEKKNNSNGKWVSWISWKNRIVRVCERQLIGLKFWEGRKWNQGKNNEQIERNMRFSSNDKSKIVI
jgi:hypothetical protein